MAFKRLKWRTPVVAQSDAKSGDMLYVRSSKEFGSQLLVAHAVDDITAGQTVKIHVIRDNVTINQTTGSKHVDTFISVRTF